MLHGLHHAHQQLFDSLQRLCLNAFCKFANATAAAAQPLVRSAASQESESESESPPHHAARGALSKLHAAAKQRRHRRLSGSWRASPSFFSANFVQKCTKVGAMTANRVRRRGAHGAVAFAQPMPRRGARRLAQQWRALQFQAQHEFATSSVHCASDNSPSLRRSTVTCN